MAARVSRGADSKHTTSGADLDVQSVDAQLLAAGGDVLGSQHGSVGRGLVTIGLDLHATGDTGDGLATAARFVLATRLPFKFEGELQRFDAR